MNDTKEKSAVGAATPATENRKNTTTVSIPEISGGIKIVLQHPGKISEVVSTAKHFNDILNGHTTVVTIPDNGLSLVVNMYSNRKGTPNLKTLWGKIYGTVLITAMEGRHFKSLTPEQIQSARGWLLKHTFEEEKK